MISKLLLGLKPMSDPQCSQTQTLSCTFFLILELDATANGLSEPGVSNTLYLALYFLVGTYIMQPQNGLSAVS